MSSTQKKSWLHIIPTFTFLWQRYSAKKEIHDYEIIPALWKEREKKNFPHDGRKIIASLTFPSTISPPSFLYIFKPSPFFLLSPVLFFPLIIFLLNSIRVQKKGPLSYVYPHGEKGESHVSHLDKSPSLLKCLFQDFISPKHLQRPKKLWARSDWIRNNLGLEFKARATTPTTPAPLLNKFKLRTLLKNFLFQLSAMEHRTRVDDTHKY